MSSNIYEHPHLTKNVKYSKGEDRRKRQERVVDIYEGLDMNTVQQVDRSIRDREPHTQKHLPAVQRTWFRVLALILGLLCLILVVGLAVLYKFYVTSIWKEEQLNIKYKNLTFELERMNCQENQTHGNTADWKRFQCSCYYISTERKNWTESRKECEKRGADLVVIKSKTKHEFYKELTQHGEFWIGLESEESWPNKWKWVDGSPPIFTAWKASLSSNPDANLKAYIDLHGTWSHTSNGSKHWICERNIY